MHLEPTSMFLLAIAGIFIIGIAGEIFFEKTGVPDVIWLILVGIVIGRFLERERLEGIAPYFGAITLVIVLFDGGSGLRLKELRDAAPRATALAVASFAMSVLVLTPVVKLACLAGILPRGWTWLHCLIVGSILGGSSSVVIMPALRMARLSPRLSNMVNLESALTDVMCVVVTMACIRIAAPLPGGEAEHPALTLAKSFGIAVVIGGVAGLIALLLLRRVKKSAYAYPLTLGYLLLLYVIIDELEGSAALGILTVAVMLGNAPALSKAVGLAKTARLGSMVEATHDQITFIVKSFFFVFIGAMLSPPWDLIFVGVGLGVLLLLARVPAVALATVKSGISRAGKGIIVAGMPRGMAAGVLAMMPTQAGVPGTERLPVVVFSAVFTSILIFAAGFPILRRRLGPEDLATAPAVPAGAPADASQSADASRLELTRDSTAAADVEIAVALPEGDADETLVDPAPPG